MSDATESTAGVEAEIFDAEMENNSDSVDSFEKQLQQQEEELQSELRLQEVQEEAKKAAAAAMVQQTVDPAPVEAPQGWQSELESGREAYGAFFTRYPYCYGYWKKFADLEKRKGTKESTLKVFEQGLASIPLSVDLWVHYLDYVTGAHYGPEHETFVREQFERATKSCGIEFRSDKMWDAYINWENSNKRYSCVTAIYDRLLATPVSKYMQHWTKFQEHVKKHKSSEVISTEEFLRLQRSLKSRDDAVAATESDDAAVAATTAADDDVDEAPPGVEEDSALNSTTAPAPVTAATEEENKSIQQLIISSREKLHQSSSNEVKMRWSYEDAIKRPYFHVKPLERSQLQAWRDYLEFETKQGDEHRIRTLYERCLIAAALYEEFWMRYLHYLESLSSVSLEEMRSVYERACTIHLKDKIKSHLSWAVFEEEKGDVTRALSLLSELQINLPDALEPRLQAIAVERRRGNLDAADDLFTQSLKLFKEKGALSTSHTNLLVKYTRFLSLFKANGEKAVDVLQTAVDEAIASIKVPSESEQQSLELLLWALVERAMSCLPPKFDVAAEALKSGMSSIYQSRTRSVFGHRYHQFIAECGQAGVSVSEATKLLRDLQHELRQIESSQEDSQEGNVPATTKPSDSSSENTTLSSDTRREKRGKSSHSYSNDRHQQQFQPHQPPPMNQGGHHHNGNMGGGGAYNQNHNSGGDGGGGGYNQQQNYPQQPNTATAPPSHQPPPQHPPPPQGQQQGYGGYNQNYQQGYPPQQYQGWGYPQQGGYGYNQQGWGAGYPNYYGQR
uniref:Pre-mRNA-processing factor 39-like n=1 Tax=Hirondellea gigas TaxID=1518452 RepID=A0A2P2I0P4_9CRUS